MIDTCTAQEQSEQLPTEHEFCMRCGRKLKNPKARAIGFGSVCEKKLKTSKQSNQLFR